jgi:hypothetical protein
MLLLHGNVDGRILKYRLIIILNCRNRLSEYEMDRNGLV